MYVVTGATGHTGNIVAKTLLAKGQRVRVIARNADRLQALVAQGAEPFPGDFTDAASVTNALVGAKGVYVMLPPSPASSDFRAFQGRVTDAIAEALRKAGTTHVVTLSSIGADKTDRTGPVAGLHYLEQQLNGIDGLNVLHLRAGYFMENTLAQIGMIRVTGTTVGPLRPDLKLPMIATEDIGEVAANALLNLDFDRKQTRELLGQRDISMTEVAHIIGNVVGKPDLRYAQAPDEQVRPVLIKLGMSENVANLLLEMSAALNSGHMRALETRSVQNTTSTSYETFVRKEFLPLYEGKSAA
jgi:uncharacterized protein YbjT (DUF2867 family)